MSQQFRLPYVVLYLRMGKWYTIAPPHALIGGDEYGRSGIELNGQRAGGVSVPDFRELDVMRQLHH